MSAKANRLFTLVIALALLIFIAWSIIVGMPIFIPVAGFVVAMLLIWLCRRFTREIMVDERTHKINEKASAISFQISSIIMALIGILFILLRDFLPNEYEIVGATLAYSVCAIMLLHLALYYYYQKKF